MLFKVVLIKVFNKIYSLNIYNQRCKDWKKNLKFE